MKKITSTRIIALIALLSIVFTACKKTDTENTKNEIAYIYKTDNTDALAFKALLEANNCNVQLISIADAASLSYSKYKLIVADHNTNAVGQNNWTDALAAKLQASGKPMLLLGMGGFLFAKKIGNTAQWDNCGQFDETGLLVTDKLSSLYKKPKAIVIPANQTISLYTVASLAAGQHMPSGTQAGVTLMGAFAGHQAYYPLSYEKNRYTVFGFYKGVNSMTSAGKDFMVNLVYAAGKFSL